MSNLREIRIENKKIVHQNVFESVSSILRNNIQWNLKQKHEYVLLRKRCLQNVGHFVSKQRNLSNDNGEVLGPVWLEPDIGFEIRIFKTKYGFVKPWNNPRRWIPWIQDGGERRTGANLPLHLIWSHCTLSYTNAFVDFLVWHWTNVTLFYFLLMSYDAPDSTILRIKKLHINFIW